MALVDNKDSSELLKTGQQQAAAAMQKYEDEKDISKHIKNYFDSKYGPNWHCVVGKGFATFGTYEAKTEMFFCLPPLNILIYKMG
mmetsp:Transcript_26657/g.40439  ORF Transcript_26657/g.40439 Transcript_26657/m.40439 type:complete len:85 (+) Transcript_26657:116-370(+)|eukprot:CAMPEP_0206470766 /NCGR_PEP_ID=MMETSP0324_2-20121206/31137_1 /ASSEMBLY_ACC=CAM_ASM_000836 /TAXON_ID=2866 /ORGANISM="Crypthecodinium cohnii, Strain Seligo" /LENGTH=84 /DNA_ID=CAMNT_0053944911 /DNA_START=116 /DNA_END=370 /DNA_ORIENTATION=+